MKELLFFLVKGITGSEDFAIKAEGDDRLNFVVEAKPDIIGLIIGKGGRTIRAIRNILKVRATLERKSVSVSVQEKGSD